MKMDALNFLKKKDKKRQKANTKRIPVHTSLQRPAIDLSNPWTIFTVVDKTVFSRVIEDFVKNAKWRENKKQKLDSFPKKQNIQFNTDFNSTDIDTQKTNFVWNSTNRETKDIDIQINETLAQIDRKHIQMFYSLRMFVPWYTAINFLKEYADDNRGLTAPELYKYYLDTPDMKMLVNDTARYLHKRQISKTAGISNAELKKSEFSQIFADYYNIQNVLDIYKSNYNIPPPCVEATLTRIDKKPVIVGGDYDAMIFSKNIENPYGDIDAIDTTWLYEYGIKGFVAQHKYDVYATSIEVKYKNKTWYKVNKLFYRQLYTDKRPYVPGAIGYIMKDSSIVVETEEMFKKLKKSFILKETKAKIDAGYGVALEMINENILLNTIYTVKELNVFANKIIDSFKPCETTKEIAKKLSFILVYYSNLTSAFSDSENVQIYIQNTKNRLYAPENLLNLQKDVLLPEVYSLPDTNPDKKAILSIARQTIAQKRREIESEFYVRLRAKVLPEGGRIPVYAKIVAQKPHIGQLGQGDNLSPGLIQKLKTLITVVPLIPCSFCGKNVYNLSYKSICSGEVKTFCNQECFDQFDFKTEKTKYNTTKKKVRIATVPQTQDLTTSDLFGDVSDISTDLDE